MKPSYIYNVKAMLGALVLAGIVAGCADNEIVDITPADNSSQRQEPYVPESDDISRALAAIEGISNMPSPFVKYCCTIWNINFEDDEDWEVEE